MVTVTGMARFGFLTLAGDLGSTDADELVTVTTELVDIGVDDLTIDLSRVTAIGPDGLDALVAADSVLGAVGGRMVLVGASPAARRVFEIDRLDRAYHIVPPQVGRRSFWPSGPAAPPGRAPKGWPHGSPGALRGLPRGTGGLSAPTAP
jgi:anti-anti-sigma factor